MTLRSQDFKSCAYTYSATRPSFAHKNFVFVRLTPQEKPNGFSMTLVALLLAVLFP